MKIRCLLTITLVLAAFTTGAFASNKEPDSNFRFSENKSKSEDKKFNNDNDKKAKDEKHVAKRDSEDEYKPLIKNEEKIKIVDFDYKDDLEKLSKINNDDHNDFLKLCQKDKEEHHEDEDEEDDDINAVPVPAALWLFGSGLLGLLGAQRKKG